MRYTCPVCGYSELDEPPYDDQNNASYEVCSCCGFEFGFDDKAKGVSFEDYRKKWINEGARWFLENKKPIDWDLKKQLKNIL